MLNLILKLFISVIYSVLIVACSGSTESLDEDDSNSNGSVIISWQSPLRNTDGSELTNLSGHMIYYGLSPENLDNSLNASNIGLNVYLIENLKTKTIYYFAITSINSDDVESSYSPIISKYIF